MNGQYVDIAVICYGDIAVHAYVYNHNYNMRMFSIYLDGGLNPSEKIWSSSVGMIFHSQDMESHTSHVPNHPPKKKYIYIYHNTS